ncbi:hypothetical protein ACFQXB_10505 [Plastorhodobacter daqingensis]|uniref:Molybdopterin molybdenumtransferase n=1 Tax=Plastorhodobacter daqingensis TaxID=1387281 RepID=A0ABW2UK79_9RHOB
MAAVAFARQSVYLPCMVSLTPLETCLAQALHGTAPVPAEMLGLAAAQGLVLAEDILLPCDHPVTAEALRAGYAVAALDLVGAGAGNPVPLGAASIVVPGEALPAGADAVLPQDGTDATAGLAEAIRPVVPGEGVRRSGHDGRRGDTILRAGLRLCPRARLVARLAGVETVPVRRPRLHVALEDARLEAFASALLRGLGAVTTDTDPHLSLRPARDHRPRLAFSPAETAWLGKDGSGLVLEVPARFDQAVAALLGLALPAMTALAGVSLALQTRPLSRKVVSTVGLTELLLLGGEGGSWHPQPVGTVTLAGLASATAFALLPPDSEGLPADRLLAAQPIAHLFG